MVRNSDPGWTYLASWIGHRIFATSLALPSDLGFEVSKIVSKI